MGMCVCVLYRMTYTILSYHIMSITKSLSYHIMSITKSLSKSLSFLVLIDDLDVECLILKYVDDTCEIILAL